jgi:hypothetical protein
MFRYYRDAEACKGNIIKAMDIPLAILMIIKDT